MALNLDIVSKMEWGSASVTRSQAVPLMTPVKHVLRTFTDTEPCYSKKDCMRTIKELQASHMEEGQYDIKYNFLIGGDGSIFEGRGWDLMPCPNYNYPYLLENCIEIAHIGYSGMPPVIIMSTTENLIALGVQKNIINKKFKLVMSFDEIEEPDNSECQKELLDPDKVLKGFRQRIVSFS